jgi:hypothetical protein
LIEGFVMLVIHRLLAMAAVVAFASHFCHQAKAGIMSETLTFSNQTLVGNQFIAWLPQGSLPPDAQLLTVSVNATLVDSVLDTFANDLTIYVDRLPLFGLGGRLQVGGTSNLQAANRLSWANGGSASPGTTVVDFKDVTALNVSIGDAQVWYGNGFGQSGTSGTFTGSVSLTYLTAVPEPSSLAFVGLGVMGIAFRFRKHMKLARAAKHSCEPERS